MQRLKRLWNDQDGFVATSDILLIAVILGLGTVVGLVTLRDQVVQELVDVAQALAALNQTYQYQGTNWDLTTPPGSATDTSYVAGSTYADATDAGQGADTAGNPPFGITITTPGDDEDTPLP